MIYEFNIKVTDKRCPELLISNGGTNEFKIYSNYRGKWHMVDTFKSFDYLTIEDAHATAIKFFDRYLENPAIQSVYEKMVRRSK